MSSGERIKRTNTKKMKVRRLFIIKRPNDPVIPLVGGHPQYLKPGGAGWRR
jgi:hypothetical protein